MATVLDRIEILDAPAIPGLLFRRFQGETDYPRMLEVITAAKTFDGVERTDSVENIANMYAHLTNCDPYQDMLFAEVDGQLVAYARGAWYQEGGTERTRLFWSVGFVHPEWRRKGIGTALLHFLQRRQKEIADAQAEDTPRFYQVEADDTQVALEAILQKDGYQPVRHFYHMVRPDLEDIPEAPMPDGLEVRPARPEHYRLIWAADVEAFRDHWGFAEPKETDYQQWLADKVIFQPELWKIAWDGDQVAGQVRGFINHAENEEYGRLRGWCEFISVRRQWRKRGLAKSLIVQTLHEFKQRGMQESALGVDTQNLSGALRLYESVGFRPVRRGSMYRKAF